MSHESFVLLAKIFGPLWMGGFLLIVALRAYAPTRRAAHERAARSVLGPESGAEP